MSKVVKLKNSVAVLATSTWAAKKGRDALVIEWNTTDKLENTAEHFTAFKAMLERGASSSARNDGDVDAAKEEPLDVDKKVATKESFPIGPLSKASGKSDRTAKEEIEEAFKIFKEEIMMEEDDGETPAGNEEAGAAGKEKALGDELDDEDLGLQKEDFSLEEDLDFLGEDFLSEEDEEEEKEEEGEEEKEKVKGEEIKS